MEFPQLLVARQARQLFLSRTPSFISWIPNLEDNICSRYFIIKSHQNLADIRAKFLCDWVRKRSKLARDEKVTKQERLADIIELKSYSLNDD
jgi:hypothetical protein